ncbi:hypothetical protein APB26_32640 [Pseudomonas aeruginosa]|uniref:hypothetical protein n=1 Tax=Pseudomonas aeruginosa TaxID=287 RepID=UPI00071BB655|nr:hypothetical protein [Pseudomonas aeruginosa]KSQ21731.1 hypothetical protein APB26_32640 [Pseudomonas aeruginosa]RPV61404.1 hypothetical protein IPC838_18980 [Pseudomonas aeruginosa]
MTQQIKKATEITKCKCCGSADLSWQTGNTIRNEIQQGRLNTYDVQCIFSLGCNYCSETLAVISADQVAALMNEQAEAARAAK